MLEERLSLKPASLSTVRRGRAASLVERAHRVPFIAGLPVLLIFVIAFAITAVWVRGIHMFSVMPDELGYVKQSLEIARTGFLIGPSDYYFNSWGQLMPLISAPLFAGLGMVPGFYAAHTLYALLLSSTAVPAYLIARELALGRLAGYLVAALSVAVPWLAMAGVVMTEALAYPVFVWAVLAMLRTLHAPSVRRDVVALAAIAVAFFTRTQLVVLGPVLVIAVLTHDTLLALDERGGRGARWAVLHGIRHTFDRHRVLWILCGLAFVGALGVLVTGSGDKVLGTYLTPATGDILAHGTVSAGLQQFDLIIVAIGVLPFTFAAAWAVGTVGRPREPARHAFAVLLIVLVVVLVLAVGSFAARFMYGATTDRYLFYLAPMMFVGTAAWVVDRRGSLITLAAIGTLAFWLLLTNHLFPTGPITILNPSFDFHRVLVGRGSDVMRALGLPNADPRIALAVGASASALLAFLVRERFATWKALLLVTIPLLAYGIAETGYVMTKITPAAAGVPASDDWQERWVDRAVPSSATVGVMIAPRDPTAEQAPGETYWTWWVTSFWNETVRRAYIFPGADLFAQGFVNGVSQDLVHGRLTGLDGANYLVKLTSDPRFGLSELVATHYQLSLYRLSDDARLLYGTSGLDQTGNVAPGSAGFVRVFGTGGSTPRSYRVVLSLQVNSSTANCPCHLVLGSRYGDASLRGATRAGPGEVTVSRVVTVPPGGYAQLRLAGRAKDADHVVWLRLLSVQVTRLGAAGTLQRSPARG